jgi:hypothetical protein
MPKAPARKKRLARKRGEKYPLDFCRQRRESDTLTMSASSTPSTPKSKSERNKIPLANPIHIV